MAAATKSSSSEFFSDHPSDERRIANIQKWMPEALKYYQAAKGTTTKTTSTKSVKRTTSTRTKY
jgi:hypothetical protein